MKTVNVHSAIADDNFQAIIERMDHCPGNCQSCPPTRRDPCIGVIDNLKGYRITPRQMTRAINQFYRVSPLGILLILLPMRNRHIGDSLLEAGKGDWLMLAAPVMLILVPVYEIPVRWLMQRCRRAER